MKAQAVVATAPEQVTYMIVEVPEPASDDVVVDIQQSWISNGTEGSFVRGERIAGDTPRHDDDPVPFPLVPGYQKIGKVVHVGDQVKDVKKGEIVFATVSRVNNMFQEMGGHVSPAVTPRSGIWKIPEEVNPLAVSGLVLTQVGYNCGIRPDVKEGDSVVVIGDGMVGHWAAQTLQYRGARVMLTGKHDERLNLFERGKEDSVVNINKKDPLKIVQEWAPDGIQVIVDTVGSVSAIESFYPVINRYGHIVSAGFHGTEGLIDIQPMRNKELTLHAPAGWSQSRMDDTLKLITSGDLKTEHLITHHFPVEKASEAFQLIFSRKEPFLGIILDWK